MSLMQILLVALVGAVFSIILKQTRQDISMMVGIATGVIILYFSIDLATEVIGTIRGVAETFGINSDYIAIVIKIIGITYLGEFAVSALKDAGESGIATKVELFSKLLVVSLAVPVFSSLVQTVSAILL